MWTFPIHFERWFRATAALLALSLILDVQQYTSGVGQGKSLAFEANTLQGETILPRSKMVNRVL